MSALAQKIYSEPYKLPAGMLALAVHAAFFALLYFGVHWRAVPPQGMVVDIWENLPLTEAPRVAPPPPAQAEPPKPVEPVKPSVKQAEPEQAPATPKADIGMAKSKKPEAKPKEVVKAKPKAEKVNPRTKREAEQRAREADQRAKEVQRLLEEQKARDEQLASEEQARARARAAEAAAIGKVVDEYVGKIQAKIKHSIVMPPDVPENARAVFSVTLLPGGTVLNTRLVKPSGSAAYDDAVERAILKAQPLPLPPDATLFSRFRELRLTFEPK